MVKSKKSQKAECAVCEHKHIFKMPDEIIEAAKKEELVIFAGAGVSTEAPSVFKNSLYEEIKDELRIRPNQKISFSKLMSRFCTQRDGRRKLLNKIKERFDYIISFPELYRNASRFHKQLSTIPQIKEIVTTNWDDLFEKECGAVPIVSPEDFVFWNNPGRKVLKVHGSINHYGTIIITEEDYKKCYKKLRDGLIGSYLKTILATKKILFIGYSFGDEDFNKIYSVLGSEMKNLIPNAYLITTDKEAKEKFDKINLTTIITDAVYFIKILKKHLISEGEMLSDEIFDKIPLIYELVLSEHDKLYSVLSCKKNPEIIFSACYQDGLLHALERIMARKNTGEYSDENKLMNIIWSYKQIRKDKLKMKQYDDVAYIDGYINGQLFLLSDSTERKKISLYYIFGVKKPIQTIKDYLILSKSKSVLHKASYEFAKKYTQDYSEGLVFHHRPFIW
ncbi:MAG: SIR2 family protein [Patescibacteria group bacterium]